MYLLQQVHAANNNNICILGDTILRLTVKDDYEVGQCTRKVVYVTDNIDKLFISREACIDLGMIPKTW